MTQLGLIKIIFLISVLLVALIAGYGPFHSKVRLGKAKDFVIGQALASGIFLGAGLIHMLGDSVNDFAALHIHYPIPFLLAGIMFLLLLLLEHIARHMLEHGQANHGLFAVLACLILSIHSLLAGAALGLSTTLSVMTILFIAIIAHKWAASFALAIQINQSTLSLKSGLMLFALFAIMTPLGILAGDMVTHHLIQYPWLAPTFNALAAGTFLYLGTLHGLSRSFMVKQCCNMWQFSYVIIGFALMAVVAIWT